MHAARVAALLLLAAAPAALAPVTTLPAQQRQPRRAAAPAAKTPLGEPVPVAPAPPMKREARAVWVATVGNIDWPSRPGLPVEQQQAELVAIMDRAAQLKMNVVIFQVRPAADALYDSKLEPWSEYLTGEMGRAPEPYYDPLRVAIDEAHRRGMELHAWFNPYRARIGSARRDAPIAATHISRTRPELVRTYGRSLWMDPGERAVQDHSVRVIVDVVRRYDVDAVHIDDYFYPYRERDAATGALLDFPDSASYARYRRAGGTLARDDWRRRNVDEFVRRLNTAVHAAKPWVRVGVSPFGLYRPGQPVRVVGFDPVDQIYADSRKWFAHGWLDYLSPQLYWPVGAAGQSYPVLLEWWTAQNVRRRHLWPGLFTSRVAPAGVRGTRYDVHEISEQIVRTRAQPGASGHVHFSMRALMDNREGLSDTLAADLYSDYALVPATPWLGAAPPARPAARLRQDSVAGTYTVSITAPAATVPAAQRPRLWVVRARYGDTEWATAVYPGSEREVAVPVPWVPALTPATSPAVAAPAPTAETAAAPSAAPVATAAPDSAQRAALAARQASLRQQTAARDALVRRGPAVVLVSAVSRTGVEGPALTLTPRRAVAATAAGTAAAAR